MMYRVHLTMKVIRQIEKIMTVGCFLPTKTCHVTSAILWILFLVEILDLQTELLQKNLKLDILNIVINILSS